MTVTSVVSDPKLELVEVSTISEGSKVAASVSEGARGEATEEVSVELESVRVVVVLLALELPLELVVKLMLEVASRLEAVSVVEAFLELVVVCGIDGPSELEVLPEIATEVELKEAVVLAVEVV